MSGRGRPELISAALRIAVTEAAGAYVLATIRGFFRSEGFLLPDDFVPLNGAMRRSTAEAYDEGIDSTSPDEVERYLRVVERVLDELAQTETPWAEAQSKRIRRELDRTDIRTESDGRLVFSRSLNIGAALASAPTWSGIHLAIKGLARSSAEPEERVGAAKELVEATIKHALTDLGEHFEPDEDIPALAKRLHRRLKVDPSGVAPTARGVETIVRILGGLTMIPQGLAELRNEGYGTGHGQAKRIAGLRSRHADLAARAAVAYAGFIMDTLLEEDAPWRSPEDA